MFYPKLPPKKDEGLAVTSPITSKDEKDDNITGKFDPRALERGAAALKAMDSSPNASKAFEITKLQETTKQKEIQKEIEQLGVSRAQHEIQRAKSEGEERRKMTSHKEEQERISAQYKAQLETEAYQKKLEDQQRQNEQWLSQQHQQFLRQEEIRRKNEREASELRREEMREEKQLQSQVEQARVREEAKGRIQQERENLDVHLRTLRARSGEERQTKLEQIHAVLGSMGGAFTSLLEDKKKLYATGTFLVAVGGGLYVTRAGAQLGGKLLEARLGKPPLVRETSRWSLAGVRSLLPWNWRADTGKALSLTKERIVLPPELSERLEWTTNSLIAAKANGTPYRHLLLYGSPGTGKTLFARTIATNANMDYALMTGGDVGPLGKDAVTEMNKLFRWANASKRGMVLFIDEAESFLRMGRGSSGSGAMSEEMRNVLSSFLYHTGTESDRFCVILATNIRSILDRAVLDRIDENFEFPLPGYEERCRMLEMFFDQYIRTPTKKGKTITVDPEIDGEFLKTVARRTEGFSGRQLNKLIVGMQAAVFGGGTNNLTKGLAETVVQWKLAHFEEDMDTVDRRAMREEQDTRGSSALPDARGVGGTTDLQKS